MEKEEDLAGLFSWRFGAQILLLALLLMLDSKTILTLTASPLLLHRFFGLFLDDHHAKLFLLLRGATKYAEPIHKLMPIRLHLLSSPPYSVPHIRL